MPLNSYEPLSDDTRALVVSAENGRRHVGKNSRAHRIIHYRVDGVILTNQKACDFIILNEKTKTAYLIELKGCRIDKAVEQLKATEETLRPYLQGYTLKFRIVCSKSRTTNTPLNSYTKIVRQLEKLGNFQKQTNELKEDISCT